MNLKPEFTKQAELVATLRDNIEMQRRQLNELNRFIWLLIHKLGGSHVMTLDELNAFPKDWQLLIGSDPEKKTITFNASTKALDKEMQKN